MRLLRLDEYGDLSLTEWAEKEVPPYAILSHRWGRDEEEVSFKDLMEDGGRNKKGYRKLLSCGNQAMKDGYVFFWVDTCCIDKSSSAELSESINSMWRWYRDSHVCYAYLDDVPARVSARQKDFSFTMSKWFTRGWTLQELLAPSKLMLFDAGWAPMGTKDELADKISRITKIDDSYLRGAGDFLIQATIAEKMSWAAKRQTKRSEDIAYCLLGLFDINMPLLYGEGQNAFRRLQEEIMKESDDHSILAWDLSVQPVPHHALVTGGGGLAPSPAYFKNYGDIVRSIGPGPVKPYAKTNRGLHIELPLLKQSGQVLALLNCRRKYDLFSDLALHLSKSADGEDQYWRASGHIDVVSTAFRSRAVLQPIYIKTGTDSADLRSDPNNGSCVIRNLLYTHNVSRVFPPWSWSPQTNSFADDTELSDEGWPSPRLVISASRVTPRTTDQLAFMVFKRRHLWGVTWDARFVPLESKAEDDLQELYRHWKFADLSELPRCQKLHSNTVALRITPLSVRSRHIVALDMISHEEQNPEALENSERWKFFVRCTKYHYVRLI
ncbi:HET-domain-containing protein, partial [Ophiobolus disseminans]